jgi:hypothetical protein
VADLVGKAQGKSPMGQDPWSSRCVMTAIVLPESSLLVRQITSNGC